MKKKVTNTSKFSSITSLITPVHSLPLTISALFYGKPGTGKTTLACTFPGPILLVDIREEGSDSVSDLKNVDLVSISSWDQFEKLYWFLESSENKYETVVIDAVTQLQDLAVEEVMKNNKSVITRREWGMAAGILKTWILNYRDLDMHTVFIAHEKSFDEEEGEDGELNPTTGPRLMPSVGSILTGCVKLIGNTFIRERIERIDGKKTVVGVDYCLRLGPHANYITKVRQPKSGYTPKSIVSADFDTLVQIIKAEYPEPELTTPKLKTKRKLKNG
jgi:phage nucleotide-binding protein